MNKQTYLANLYSTVPYPLGKEYKDKKLWVMHNLFVRSTEDGYKQVTTDRLENRCKLSREAVVAYMHFVMKGLLLCEPPIFVYPKARRGRYYAYKPVDQTDPHDWVAFVTTSIVDHLKNYAFPFLGCREDVVKKLILTLPANSVLADNLLDLLSGMRALKALDIGKVSACLDDEEELKRITRSS